MNAVRPDPEAAISHALPQPTNPPEGLLQSMPRRVLLISSLFPPNVIGGAEMSAFNAAQWLSRQGCEVGVLTTAADREQVVHGKMVHGVRMWRVLMPRSYQMIDFPQASFWKKPVWHLQDHFDPRNRRVVRSVLESFKPDFVNIHVAQGIGHNFFEELAEVPTCYFLHDLGLACIRQSMFAGGTDCSGQCAVCHLSSRWKQHNIRKAGAVGFCSPSRANLEALAQYFPLTDFPHAAILNPNKYPEASVQWTEATHLRFLYVGRIDATKGIAFLLDVLHSLAERYSFTMTVIGKGPDEDKLRSCFADAHWCRFTGFITQQEISDHMASSDVMFIPSIWAENSPGVVVHARGIGLPVVGSNRGGIPELIEAEKTGSLVEPGNAAAWSAEIERILNCKEIVREWRANSFATRDKFDQDAIGRQILNFMATIASSRRDQKVELSAPSLPE